MNKTLLAILAHPDDESFGPGGTLAKYAAEGVDVHICIATDGAAGSVGKEFEDKRNELASIRAVELQKAVAILGGTLHDLGYRDSGMQGDPNNDHPDAFIRSDDSEAIGRVVRLIRAVRPNIILTHDETGGYFHPDHIRCWEIVAPAFDLAADASAYPDFGAPHQAESLYFTAIPNKWIRVFARMARITGQDPTKFGRNKDIDLTKIGHSDDQLHTHINVKPYMEVKQRASAEHASQGGGAGPFARMPMILQRQMFGTESFIRAHPPVEDGFKETGFFGV